MIRKPRPHVTEPKSVRKARVGEGCLRVWEEPESIDEIETWFVTPWSAAAAIGLAVDAAGRVGGPPRGSSWGRISGQLATNVLGFLRRAQKHAIATPDTPPPRLYTRAAALRYSVSRSALMAQQRGHFLLAGLECVSKFVARSSGGGAVYNAYLHAAVREVIEEGAEIEDLRRLVAKWRAKDRS